MSRRRTLPALFALPFVMLSGCADGGKEKRPTSAIRVAANHQLFALIARAAFGEYPLKKEFAVTDFGTFIMRDDSLYQVTRPNVTPASPDEYALGAKGDLVLRVAVSGRSAPTRYSGGYTLDGTTQAYFFTDRFAPSATSGVGLFFGTRFIAGTADPKGDWHLFSLHLIFSPSKVLSPHNVARSVAGAITIDNALKVTGTGKESSKATLKFAGNAQAFADGEVTLSLEYDDSQTKDTRIFQAGLSNTLILGADDDEKGGEGGLIALIRKRAGTLDKKALAGTYLVGLQTFFVDPGNPGTDAAVGTLVLNESGGFKLNATGQQGGSARSFSYNGSYTATDDGALTFTVSETKETWQGAVDQDYKVLVLCDNFVEVRTGVGNPELNLGLGIREKTP